MVLGVFSPDTTEFPEIMNKTRSLDFIPVTQDGTQNAPLESTSSPTMTQAGTTPTYMIKAETEVCIVDFVFIKELTLMFGIRVHLDYLD